MSTTTHPHWRWKSHWNPAPPPGWDGRHQISVRGYATVFETSGVALSCSCGREAHVSDDTEEGGPVSLTAITELAIAHEREPGI